MSVGPLWRRLVDFWVQPLSPEPLALFRIAIGAVSLLSVLCSIVPDLDRHVGADELCAAEALDYWLGSSGRFCLLRGPAGVPFLEKCLSEEQAATWAEWGADMRHVRVLFALWLLSLALLTAGLFTRLTTLVAWALAATFHHRLSWLLNGGDYLSRAALFYLLFAPSGAAWSLDNLLWKRVPRPIPAWPVRLMQIQLCLVYLGTGVVKLHRDWYTGEAVYWVLNDVALARWPYCRLPVPMLLCRLASWGTLAFELGFPVLVWLPRVRPWLLAAGVAFHAGIWAATEVGWFSPVVVCWYALFVAPATAGRVMRLFFGSGVQVAK